MTNPLSGDESTTLARLTTSGTYDDKGNLVFTTARMIRERAGYNASDFAGRVGVAARTLRSWEDGRAAPRQPYAARKYLSELRRASQDLVDKVEQKRRDGR